MEKKYQVRIKNKNAYVWTIKNKNTRPPFAISCTQSTRTSTAQICDGSHLQSQHYPSSQKEAVMVKKKPTLPHHKEPEHNPQSNKDATDFYLSQSISIKISIHK